MGAIPSGLIHLNSTSWERNVVVVSMVRWCHCLCPVTAFATAALPLRSLRTYLSKRCAHDDYPLNQWPLDTAQGRKVLRVMFSTILSCNDRSLLCVGAQVAVRSAAGCCLPMRGGDDHTSTLGVWCADNAAATFLVQPPGAEVVLGALGHRHCTWH